MKLEDLKQKLNSLYIPTTESQIDHYPTIIGLHQRRRIIWMGIQMNVIIMATDFGDKNVTVNMMQRHLAQTEAEAGKILLGPMFHSGVAVISILMSSQISDEAMQYVEKVRQKQTSRIMPMSVLINSKDGTFKTFKTFPLFGIAYYPVFRKMINKMNQSL